MSEFFGDDGNAQLLQRRDFRRNQSKHCAITVRLLEIIAAKTRSRVHFVGEIEVAALLENFPVPLAANLAQHRHRLIAHERLLTNRRDIAMLAHLRRLALADVQIGASLIDNDVQKLIQRSHD